MTKMRKWMDVAPFHIQGTITIGFMFVAYIWWYAQLDLKIFGGTLYTRGTGEKWGAWTEVRRLHKERYAMPDRPVILDPIYHRIPGYIRYTTDLDKYSDRLHALQEESERRRIYRVAKAQLKEEMARMA